MSPRGSGIPEMAMFLSMTGLTALPCTVYAVVLQYNTLLPLLSVSCTDGQGVKKWEKCKQSAVAA